MRKEQIIEYCILDDHPKLLTVVISGGWDYVEIGG